MSIEDNQLIDNSLEETSPCTGRSQRFLDAGRDAIRVWQGEISRAEFYARYDETVLREFEPFDRFEEGGR